MWIEIFKSGEHKDSSGNSHNFSHEDLSEIVSKYNDNLLTNPNLLAPLVKGHPWDSDPAYGWIEKLAKRGNSLLAKLKDVSLDTLDEIKRGQFKNVSISLYPNLNLRHVGLLGAVPPAVKGLMPISFNDMELNINFNDAFESLDTEKLKLEIDLLKKEKRLKEHRDFAESLIDSKSGVTIPPVMRTDIIDFLEYTSQMDANSPSPSDSKVHDKFKAFFENLKPFLNFNEITIPNQFAEQFTFQFQNVDSNKLNLHNSAMKLIQQNHDLSYEEAILQIQKNSL